MNPQQPVQSFYAGTSLVAMVIRASYSAPGVTFFTPPEYSQQLGYHQRSAGEVSPAHTHLPIKREVLNTLEVILVRSGRVRVDLFDSNEDYIGSVELSPHDTILLVSGGHALEILEDASMIEVKQGPFAGQHDKRLFTANIQALKLL